MVFYHCPVFMICASFTMNKSVFSWSSSPKLVTDFSKKCVVCFLLQVVRIVRHNYLLNESLCFKKYDGCILMELSLVCSNTFRQRKWVRKCRATNFCTMAPNILGFSVRNLFRPPYRRPEFCSGSQKFGKYVHP